MAPPTLTGAESWSSNASLLSSSPSTECTTSGSSSSTVPGPGAITGKALKALGKATLRGLDRIIILRHLTTITHIFPHTDEQASQIRNINSIYDDLLEFSRPGMYSAETYYKALGFILGQIGMGETRYLISALSRWHLVELHILLSEILIQITPLWNPSLKLVFLSPLFHSYTATRPWSQTSSLPLILFFSRLIRTSRRACRVALDVGFLDVLLAMCHTYDFNNSIPNRRKSSSGPPQMHNQLFIACNAALLDITAYLDYREFISRHPITSLWPDSGRAPTDTLPRLPFTTRRKAILLGTNSDVSVSDDFSPYVGISLKDICSQPCVSTIPAEELLRSLIFEVTYDQAIRVYLSQSSHEKRVALLSQLLESMLNSVTRKPDIPDTPDEFSRRYQVLFYLDFIGAIAQNIPGGRQALLDAGVLSYLVHILETEIPNSYFALITALQRGSLNIPRIIRENGLSYLVKERGGSSTRLQSAIHGAFAAIFPQSSASKPPIGAAGKGGKV